jgi:[ribosomal protein S5]-alanine N-acetyltransferase
VTDPGPRASVRLLLESDAAALLRFEEENRAFFEATLPPRPTTYFSLESVQQSITASLTERRAGSAYMYVIVDDDGEIVGRVNLSDVVRGPVQGAQLGYRIGEAHQGRGHATRGVAHVLLEAFDEWRLHRVEASTAARNVASQIVLLRNDFEFYGRARRSLLVHGTWVDSVCFERHRDGP